MTPNRRTAALIVAVVGGLIAYDIWAASDQAPGDTISEVIWRGINGRPYIPFLAGFLCGHLFWQRENAYAFSSVASGASNAAH